MLTGSAVPVYASGNAARKAISTRLAIKMATMNLSSRLRIHSRSYARDHGAAPDPAETRVTALRLPAEAEAFPGRAPATERTSPRSIAALRASTSSGIPTPMIQTDPRKNGLEITPCTYTITSGAARRAENDTTKDHQQERYSGTSASSATTVVTMMASMSER